MSRSVCVCMCLLLSPPLTSDLNCFRYFDYVRFNCLDWMNNLVNIQKYFVDLTFAGHGKTGTSVMSAAAKDNRYVSWIVPCVKQKIKSWVMC